MHNSNSFYEEPVDNLRKIIFEKNLFFEHLAPISHKNNLNDMRVCSSTRSVQKIIAFQIGIGQP